MSSPDDATTKPSAVLRDEHETIKRVLGVLERLLDSSSKGAGFEADSLRRCVEFFQLFADACHHAKEEDLLFPVLESRGIPREGGPIGVMLFEHQQARALTKAMAEALDDHEKGEPAAQERFQQSAAKYLDLLTNHIFKEDNILFEMGDRCMSAEDQTALSGRFCELRCKTFGGKRREELEGIADELERRWPG